MKPSKSYLRREMWNYLTTVPDAAEQELAALATWVKQGYSPYCNPSHIADEQGRELPFIHALRVEQELAEETENELSEKVGNDLSEAFSGVLAKEAGVKTTTTLNK